MPAKGYRKCDAKTSTVILRLTEDERKQLEMISNRLNISYSEFIRKRIEVFYKQYFKENQ